MSTMGRGSRGTGSTGRGSSGRKSKSYVSVKDFTDSLKVLVDTADTAASVAVVDTAYKSSFDEAESIPFAEGATGTIVLTGTDEAELSNAVQQLAAQKLQSMASLVEQKIGALLK